MLHLTAKPIHTFEFGIMLSPYSTRKWLCISCPIGTIFHQLLLGFILGPQWFFLAPPGFLDTNMLITVIRNACLGGLNKCNTPTQMGLHSGGI